jgi:hypothetical protein
MAVAEFHSFFQGAIRLAHNRKHKNSGPNTKKPNINIENVDVAEDNTCGELLELDNSRAIEDDFNYDS